MYTGPHLIKDNLVFGYDTGYGVADSNTPTRFYPGRPTSNIVPDAYTMSGWGNYSSGNDGTFITEYGTTGYKVRNKNTWNGISKGITLPSTGTYTISAWFRIWGKSSGNNGINVYTSGGGLSDTAQGGDDTNIGVWQRIAMTRTYTTTSLTFFIISWGGTSGTDWSSWDVTMPQIEKQSTQSPFLTGTRSSTQSLIDLKNTTDIDVSNVSFDSTGQPEFDGTDDTIQISDPNVSSSVGFSIEMIIKPSNASSSPMVITPNSGGIDHFVRFNSNGRLYMRMVVAADSSVQDFTTTTSLSSTDYHYTVFTFKQSEGGKAYYNGSQESAASANFTALDWSSIWKIGQRGNNTFFFDGEIPILKIHNQVLTADQVKQNYRAYKNRFDL